VSDLEKAEYPDGQHQFSGFEFAIFVGNYKNRNYENGNSNYFHQNIRSFENV
jgi:hypothetical protein